MDDLERLYKNHYQALFAYALSLTRNREEAEDLTAETFYRAITHIGSFRGESNIGVWLCGIARNVFLTEQKKRRRKPPPPPDLNDALSIEDKESVREILIYMNGLEEPYRGVFLLRTVGEADYAEIAAIYKKSESWARVTYYRARIKIIEKMEERHE